MSEASGGKAVQKFQLDILEILAGVLAILQKRLSALFFKLKIMYGITISICEMFIIFYKTIVFMLPS